MKDERANDVNDVNEVGTRAVQDEARRDFLKKAGKIAVTAPAVAILLRASAASAQGTNPYAVESPEGTDPKFQQGFGGVQSLIDNVLGFLRK